MLDQSNDQAISADERDKRKHAAADKAKEINNSKVALDQFQRQAEAQLADQSQRMSGNLVTEIQKAVADKAKAGGYSMVLNAADHRSRGLSATPSADITDAVLAQLNAGAPIDLNKPSGGVPHQRAGPICPRAAVFEKFRACLRGGKCLNSALFCY